MKKGSKPSEASLERYDWSQARRGRWAGRLRTAHPVLVRPEIYREFGSDEAVNPRSENGAHMECTRDSHLAHYF